MTFIEFDSRKTGRGAQATKTRSSRTEIVPAEISGKNQQPARVRTYQHISMIENGEP